MSHGHDFIAKQYLSKQYFSLPGVILSKPIIKKLVPSLHCYVFLGIVVIPLN